MKRRLIALLVAALAFVPTAGAVRVHVRVEGETRNIFGATEPVLDVKVNALDALEAASLAGEFYYHVAQTAFGPYVDQIGRYPAGGSNGWVFKVDGKSPPVGADQVTLHDGDTVLWYWATFDANGKGSQTLALRRKGNCYRVFAQDDNGSELHAPGAVLHVDGRTRKASFFGTCIGHHHSLVYSTAPGMVRSNALA